MRIEVVVLVIVAACGKDPHDPPAAITKACETWANRQFECPPPRNDMMPRYVEPTLDGLRSTCVLEVGDSAETPVSAPKAASPTWTIAAGQRWAVSCAMRFTDCDAYRACLDETHGR